MTTTQYNREGKKYVIVRENIMTNKKEEIDSMTSKKVADKIVKMWRETNAFDDCYYFVDVEKSGFPNKYND